MSLKNKFKWGFFVTLSLSFIAFIYPPSNYAYGKPKPYTYYKGGNKNLCGKTLCQPFRFYTTLSGGLAWATVGESQSFVDDGSTYDYSADKANQKEALWGASVGGELRFSPDWSMQVGLSYYQSAAFEGKGTVTQGVDPDSSETFSYSFKVITRQYLVESKILLDAGMGFHPYVSFGIGASFNQTSDYNAPVSDFLTFTPLYKGLTNTALSGNAGFGVDMDLMEYARIGIGYRYSWLGAANLGDGRINTTEIANTLKQNIDAQEAILQLTILI